MLGWSPSEFWEASLYDLLPALDGYAEKNGGGRREEPQPKDKAKVAQGLAALLRGKR